ncbi:hypothetical protein [Streptomyces sp. NBRC 109706]|uniref:hypothetical protein n=1 Tax=Streptomyces sp. NBRC 109706 TaxID=1550035 RepID=UPI00131E08D9|nr:hypothetical protein [Streptomyces sp. NBRC 109706]
MLTADGVFVTQQVGGRDLEEVNEALGAPPHTYRDFSLASAVAELERGGFAIDWRQEARVEDRIADIAALVLFLRITPWHVPDFDVDRYAEQLDALHRRMDNRAPLHVSCHRFALVARPLPEPAARPASI